MTSSATTESKPTKKTKELTQAELLQVLGDVLLKYQSLGGKVEIMPEFWYSGTRAVAIILEGLKIDNGNLVRTPETEPKP